TELGELHLCRGSIVEVAETGSERCEEGRFVGKGRCHSLSPSMDSGELGENGSGPGSCITIKEAKGNLDLQLDGGEGRVNRPVDEQLGDEAVAFDDRFSIGWRRKKTLPATRGTKDCPWTKATVVTVHRANFARNECSGGLMAETAVKVPEEVWRRGYICQGLLTWRRVLSARRAEQDPSVFPSRLTSSRDTPQAQALVQGLEGDLLALDWDRRQFGEVGARLLLATVNDSLRAIWDVNVDEVLRVEGVNLALIGSHDGWGEDGELTPTAPEVTLGFAIHVGPSTAFG
ncbi:hypothetical protein POSPLADRAFT_1138689, partial [Postia placenta MAD-698-R-SB12]